MEPYGAAESSIGLHRAAHEKLKIFLRALRAKRLIFFFCALRARARAARAHSRSIGLHCLLPIAYCLLPIAYGALWSPLESYGALWSPM